MSFSYSGQTFYNLSGNKPETIIFGITPKDYKTLSTELTPELKSSIQKIIKTILKEIK